MIKMTEMDKTRDMKGGASRFSKPQSGLNGDFVSSEKFKGERIRSLSAVNGAISYEEEEKHEIMGCDVSCRDEEELPSQPSSTTGKRFKLPRKRFFDECNGADNTSIPRKLRSAMKKRSRESLSQPFLDSKKLNHTNGRIGSPKGDGVKKLKLRQKDPGWSQKQCVYGPLTKDEEEVAETLYALAGMFPDNEPKNGTKLDGVSLDANHSALAEASESCPLPLEDSAAIKQDSNSFCFLSAPEEIDPTSTVQRLPEETVEVNSSNEPIVQESLELTGSKKNQVEKDGSVAEVDLQTMLTKHEEPKPLRNSTNFYVQPELYQDTSKLKQPTKLETTLLCKKPEISLGLTTTGAQVERQHVSHKYDKNGPALWPCLSSTISGSALSHGSSSQYSAAKIPSWLDTAPSATRPNSFQTSFSTGKVSKVYSDRRSWKRCAAHLYISHLIQASQMPESKDGFPLHPNEILKQGVFMTVNDFNGTRNGSNGVKSASSIVNDTEKNENEAVNGILPLLGRHQDQTQTALVSGVHTSKKQSFNFLSLSARGGGVETNTSFSGSGNELELLAQLQVPYLHSHLQQPTLMPYSVSQTRYTSSSSSSSYPIQPSVPAAQQAQLQLPPYLGNPFNGPHTNSTTLTKQKQHQQLLLQQQQQRLWAAQYRTAGTSTGMAHFPPSWPKGMQDSPTLIPYARAAVPSSPTSLDIRGPKYPQISYHHQRQQQQQQLLTISSLPYVKVKKQDDLSSVYGETGGGFHYDGALPLQLLCNERL